MTENDFRAELLLQQPWLRSTARTMFWRFPATASGADDLAQQTTEQALRAKRRPEVANELRPWLYMIMKNQAMDQRRRAIREPAMGEMPDLRVMDGGAEDRIFIQELTQHFAAQHPLLRALGEEREYEEMALMFGVPVGTIKSRVNRFRSTAQEWRE